MAKGRVLKYDRSCKTCGTSPIYGYKYCDECKRSAERQPSKWWRTCQGCGKRYYNSRRRESEGNIYCSRECAFEHAWVRRGDVGGPPLAESWAVYFQSCAHCGRVFSARRSEAKMCSDACRKEGKRLEWRWKNKPKHEAVICPECGVMFTPLDGLRTMCSDACGKRKAGRVYNGIRRARSRGEEAEPVDPIKVLDRDGWHCQICGKPTPKSERGTWSDSAPEVDHIVALARGGSHRYVNTQCACRACNQDKGASV